MCHFYSQGLKNTRSMIKVLPRICPQCVSSRMKANSNFILCVSKIQFYIVVESICRAEDLIYQHDTSDISSLWPLQCKLEIVCCT